MNQQSVDLEKALGAEQQKLSDAIATAARLASKPAAIRQERETVLLAAQDGDAKAQARAEKLRTEELQATLEASDAESVVRLRRSAIAKLEREIKRAEEHAIREAIAALEVRQEAQANKVDQAVATLQAAIAEAVALGEEKYRTVSRIYPEADARRCVPWRALAGALHSAFAASLPHGEFKREGAHFRRPFSALLGEMLGRSAPTAGATDEEAVEPAA